VGGRISGWSTPAVGLLTAGAWLIAATGLGVGLSVAASPDPSNSVVPVADSTGSPGRPTYPAPTYEPPTYDPPTEDPPTSGPTEEPVPTPTEDPTPTPDPESTLVSGPRGLVTAIPVGWVPRTLPNAGGNVEADDPADPNHFVRYGGVPAGDLLARRVKEETGPSISVGYQRLVLATTDFHGHPAVEWVFEFDKKGVHRHVHALYWNAGGTEYVVYASAPADRWDEMEPVFTEMTDNARP
jgi:hypothetical protein